MPVLPARRRAATLLGVLALVVPATGCLDLRDTGSRDLGRDEGAIEELEELDGVHAALVDNRMVEDSDYATTHVLVDLEPDVDALAVRAVLRAVAELDDVEGPVDLTVGVGEAELDEYGRLPTGLGVSRISGLGRDDTERTEMAEALVAGLALTDGAPVVVADGEDFDGEGGVEVTLELPERAGADDVLALAGVVVAADNLGAEAVRLGGGRALMVLRAGTTAADLPALAAATSIASTRIDVPWLAAPQVDVVTGGAGAPELEIVLRADDGAPERASRAEQAAVWGAVTEMLDAVATLPADTGIAISSAPTPAGADPLRLGIFTSVSRPGDRPPPASDTSPEARAERYLLERVRPLG